MVREESAVVSGTVNAVVFRNAENGYTVLRLGLGGGDVTCVGCIPGVNVGEVFVRRILLCVTSRFQ